MGYKTCVQDTCKCENCYCDVLSLYAKLCMDAGVDVTGWRDQTEHCKLKCPANQVLRQCAIDEDKNPVCTSCTEIIRGSKCEDHGCIEGCYCPPGYYEND